jgi:hypothetical protein
MSSSLIVVIPMSQEFANRHRKEPRQPYLTVVIVNPVHKIERFNRILRFTMLHTRL